jgi:hypothetical protein
VAQSTIQPHSERMRQAIRWISEESQNHPEKPRKQIIKEAELRFDLTPAECEFLDKHFSGQ